MQLDRLHRVPGLDVGHAVRLLVEGLALAHQGGGGIDAGEFLIAVEPVRTGEVTPVTVKLAGEGVVEALPGPPEKADAELPRGFGEFIEPLPGDSEVVKEVTREVGSGAFAHSNDADVRTAHDAHVQLRNFLLQGEGGDEARTAGTEDKDVLNHGGRGGQEG